MSPRAAMKGSQPTSSHGSAFHLAAQRYGRRTAPLRARKEKRTKEEDGGKDEQDNDEDDNDDERSKGKSSQGATPLVQPLLSAWHQRLESALAHAEDRYSSGHPSRTETLALRTNVVRKAGAASDRYVTVEDEGLERTRVRALLAETRPTHFDEDQQIDEQHDATAGARSKGRGNGNAESVYVGDRKALMPVFRSEYEKRRVKNTRGKKRAIAAESELEKTVERTDADEHDAMVEQDNLAAQTEREIEAMRDGMPDTSLLEVVHSLAAHYYDARDMMFDREVVESRPSASGGRGNRPQTEYGMFRVCEGNALVAVAVYLEELAKWEAGLSYTPASIQSRNRAKDETAEDRRWKAYRRMVELQMEEEERKMQMQREEKRERRESEQSKTNTRRVMEADRRAKKREGKKTPLDVAWARLKTRKRAEKDRVRLARIRQGEQQDKQVNNGDGEYREGEEEDVDGTSIGSDDEESATDEGD